MAIVPDLTDIGSGFSRTPINNNFAAITAALANALSRSGTSPNHLLADVDLNDNDLLNVNTTYTSRLFLDGSEFVGADAVAVGDKGWSPSFSIVDDGTRRVLRLVDWVGGQGTKPGNIGDYIGASGFVSVIGSAVDIRGPQGASGAGTGDMLSTQNLNDVASKPTAFANIKQAATDTSSGVLEIATNTEADTGVDTGRAVVPSNLPSAVPAHSPLGLGLLVDPGADRVLFWDDSAGTLTWLSLGSGLSIVGTTLSVTSGTGITLLTEQATTSGSTKDFTIPSGAKRVTIMFDGVSLAVASTIGIQLGDSGGIETSGYDGVYGTSTMTTDRFTLHTLAASSNLVYGSVTLSLMDASNTWVESGVIGVTATSNVAVQSGGRKTLSGELTTVRIIGGNNFDAGSVNVSYE